MLCCERKDRVDRGGGGAACCVFIVKGRTGWTEEVEEQIVV